MNGKSNTPRTVCGIIVAVAVAAAAIAVIVGCTTDGGSRRQNIAAVIQTAYDLGGREAVSNKIESLVAEGKLTPSQAVRLHALAQLAYEGIMDDLATGNAATNTCDACNPDAPCDGGECADCNEDANCGQCEDCEAQR